MKSSSSKNFKFIVILIIFAISIFVIPIVINESYKSNSGYMTLWEPKDLLLYFGAVISSIGTIFIGIIAFKQSERANDISNRLLKLEEINSIPYLHIDLSTSKIQTFMDREIDFLIGLRNQTNAVINITEVSNLKAESFPGQALIIPFCKGWSTHYTVLPQQSKQINFYDEVKHNDKPLVDMSQDTKMQEFMQLKCELEIKLNFVNSTDIYQQKLEFYLHIYSQSNVINKNTKYKFNIYSLENSVEKENTGK